MQYMITFQYQEDKDHFSDFTTIDIDGEPWFVAKEICDLLDIKNARQAVSSLDDDEKSSVIINDGTSGNPNKTIVSEGGLYELIFRSTKPNAKKFRKWITKEVIPSIRRTGSYGINRLETPNFMVRYNENWDRTEKGYFSVLNELYIRLYARFEKVGYKIPNKAMNGVEIRPDGSAGKRFPKFLADHYPDRVKDFKKYLHKFQNGKEVEARQYKNDLLHIFIEFIDDYWLPNVAEEYFEDRDPLALEYLPKLLEVGKKK